MKQEKKSVQSSVRLPACVKQLTVLTAAVITLTVLFLSGCASHRKIMTAANQEQIWAGIRMDSVVSVVLDSVSELVEIRTEAVRVPMSEVRLTIATDSLRMLPAGSSYSGRNGQAGVKVSRQAATASEPEYIYVDVTCDSLLLQCERYERLIRNFRNSWHTLTETQGSLAASVSHHTEQVEKPPNMIGMSLKWFLAGLVSGIIGTIIIFIKLKK